MHWIEDKLISDDVLEEYFACELSACKGACCWEGAFGAPLEESELETMRSISHLLFEQLPEQNQRVLKNSGPYTWYEELDKFGTSLLENGACVFLGFDDQGIGYCTIEKAWRDGHSEFRKPISCHLYPIRVQHHEATGMTALNYDRWSICSAACTKGKKEQIPLFEFAREAIIRAFGESFYEAMEAAAEHQDKDGPKD